MKLTEKVKELEKRIKELEARPQHVNHYWYTYPPYQPLFPQPYTPTWKQWEVTCGTTTIQAQDNLMYRN